MRIAINGFGRIGRTILRQLLSDPAHADIEIALINDIAAPDRVRPISGDVSVTNGMLHVAGREIRFTTQPDISVLDLSDIDLVIECTGTANTLNIASRGLDAGATSVLISGPSPAAEVTVVLGANDDALGDQRIVSNASCTTNAIAPLLKALNDDLGIVSGHMTTIHCYTGSQPMVDAPRSNPARSRAGAVSMVPTTTSATALVNHVLPELEGKISGAAVRVPCISVSAVDLTVQLQTLPDCAGRDLSRIGWPLIIPSWARPATLSCRQTCACALNHWSSRCRKPRSSAPIRRVVFGWYDNEWGYSARVIDLARLMAAR
ncbi:Glyceraldehyde-3-phosphate dehydrogenase [Nymphon striatum]|nr:Glyceraldehyde-3-phosphate dehydrogenase [Nymphon striatum]